MALNSLFKQTEKGCEVVEIKGKWFLKIIKANYSTKELETYLFNISEDDVERIKSKKWYAAYFTGSNKNKEYLKVYHKEGNQCITLSKFVLKYYGLKYILHKNGNHLDYRRSNLMIRKSVRIRDFETKDFKYGIKVGTSRNDSYKGYIRLNGKYFISDLTKKGALIIANKLEKHIDEILRIEEVVGKDSVL